MKRIFLLFGMLLTFILSSGSDKLLPSTLASEKTMVSLIVTNLSEKQIAMSANQLRNYLS